MWASWPQEWAMPGFREEQAEENAASSGAKKMIEDGVLDNPKVDAMFGQHVWPALPVLSVRGRASMSARRPTHLPGPLPWIRAVTP